MMKNLEHSEDLIELGAISAETRGIEPVGLEDQDPSDKYLFAGGISVDD